MVTELQGIVVAWASLSPWSGRCAYSATAEISLYVDEEHRGRGIGKALTASVLEAGRSAGLHTIIARTVSENSASIHILEQWGFEHVGIMREVGMKFGRRLDVCLLQKIYR
jgi:phosphinothricin acetyltransferase